MERGIGNRYVAFTRVVACISFLTVVFAIGCAGTETVVKESGETARVRSIHAVEEDGAVKVIIEGSRSLEHTSIKQPFPLSVILHLQGASIDGLKIAEVEENEVISSIAASESIANSVVSRIEILLKKDVAFDVDEDGNFLVASFSKTIEAGDETSSEVFRSPDATGTTENPDNGSGSKRATQLSDVEAVAKDGFVEVNLRADGKITDFESFRVEETIENPARIVFDVFNVNAAFSEERTIELGSNLAERVRYRGYKDRIRLVVDTQNQYLATFLAKPSENGLRILLGDKIKQENNVLAKTDTASAEATDIPNTGGEGAQVSEEAASKTAYMESDLQEQEVVRQGNVVAESAEPTGEEVAASSPEKSEKEPSSLSAPVKGTNALSFVSALPSGDSLVISVGAAGPVEKYDASTIRKSDTGPARIVVDMYDLHSPFDGERTVPVDFEKVDRVRHKGYAEKVRLVVDTQDVLLSAFTVRPSENGLEITIGPPAATVSEPNSAIAETGSNPSSSSEIPAALDHKEEPAPENKVANADVQAASAQPPQTFRREETEQVSYSGPNWVKRIDFSSRPAGKSTLSIGAARPIRYEINEVSDKTLAVRLFDTRIAEHQKRPLITTRFESAVDRILPIQTTSMKDSVVSVELREKTPYQVETFGNELLVNFEASQIPPKPLEEAGLPSWRQAMTEALAEPAAASPGAPPVGPDSATVGGIEPASPLSAAPAKENPDGKIALNFYETDIKEVCRIFGEVSGKNFYIDSDVKGSVTLTSKELVPWEQALELILNAKQLRKEESGNFIRITKTKKYVGEKIALDFYETNIKNVFRILRDVSGTNFAIDPDVEGTVTLTLEKPVPWDQVLDVVLEMNQLGKEEEYDIVRIAKIATLTNEESTRKRKLEEELKHILQQQAMEPLDTDYINVNYANAAKDILPHLVKTEGRGKISADERTNMIIVTDTILKIQEVREIVQRLDKVTSQVIIEARVVEASSSFSREIGIEWSTDGGIANNDPKAGIGPQRGYDALGGTWAYDTAVNLPVPEAGQIGFQFQRIFGSPLTIDAQLGAMESQGEGKVVSAPKVMTLNNKMATIKQGREVPYSVIDDEGQANVQFKNVDLLLEVTPHVTTDDRISLNVKITKNEIAEFSVDGVPSISTKEAKTELLVNDGETIVIGGILQTTDQETVAGVPVLYKIPVLSWLFKWDRKESRKEELLIFLTPRIMQLEQKDI